MTPLPFSIFSGDGGTDLDVKADLIGAGMVDEEAEEVVMVVVVVEFILTLAPSAFTRLGIFSRLTTGTGTLKHQRKSLHDVFSAPCYVVPRYTYIRQTFLYVLYYTPINTNLRINLKLPCLVILCI